MILLTGTYIHASEDRMAEYVGVLRENLRCEQIHEIHLFIEDPVDRYFSLVKPDAPRGSLRVLYDLLQHPKIRRNMLGRRATYAEYFEYANNLGPGKVCVLSNADIYFDHTLERLSLVDMDKTFVILAKWNDNLLHSPADSQDSWIFKTPVRRMLSNWTLGVPGCENRIAFEAKAVGYEILNPAWSIRAHHCHASNIRSWTQDDRLVGQYFTLQPVTLPGREKDMPIYRAV